MADLQIIYDPNVELAAVIDLDTREALPIAAAGTDAATILEAFLNSASWDITVLTPESLIAAYDAFLGALTAPPVAQATEGAPDDVGASDGVAVDGGAALADREATEAGGVPEPQPADTDMGADTGTQTTKVRCYNCEGEGVLHFGDGSPDQQCPMCKGTGTIMMPVAS